MRVEILDLFIQTYTKTIEPKELTLCVTYTLYVQAQTKLLRNLIAIGQGRFGDTVVSEAGVGN